MTSTGCSGANPGGPTIRRFLVPIVAVLLLATACATPRKPPPPARDLIVLLPDEQGKTGAIIVTSAGLDRRLDQPNQSVVVSSGTPPGSPTVMTDNEVIVSVGLAISALPKPPVQFILYFHHDSAVLTSESRVRLQDVFKAIRDRGQPDISVVGHTDTLGKDGYNDRLSLRRAEAVADLLVKSGVDRTALDITSHGKHNPLIPTGDQVREPRNRRVEVTVR